MVEAASAPAHIRSRATSAAGSWVCGPSGRRNPVVAFAPLLDGDTLFLEGLDRGVEVRRVPIDRVGRVVALTVLTRNALKGLVKGKWQTLSVTDKGASVVWVVFADQADFDAAKAHFGGQARKSNIVGAVDGFSYVLP